MENPEYHICPICNWSWVHGQNGNHSCSDNLLRKIEKLEFMMKKTDDELSDMINEAEYNKGLTDREIVDMASYVMDRLDKRIKFFHTANPMLETEIVNAITLFLEENNRRIDIKPKIKIDK